MKHGHEKAIESPLKRCFLKQADIPLQGSEGQGSPQGARAPKGPGGSHNSQGAGRSPWAASGSWWSAGWAWWSRQRAGRELSGTPGAEPWQRRPPWTPRNTQMPGNTGAESKHMHTETRIPRDKHTCTHMYAHTQNYMYKNRNRKNLELML